MTRLWMAALILLVPLCFLAVYPESARGLTCVDISRTLSLNTKGTDVSNLQEFLRTNAGYAGTISGNMGPLTVAALTRWQIYKGVISSSATPGAGTTGPRTRAAMACAVKVPAPASSASPTQGSANTSLLAQLTTLQQRLAELQGTTPAPTQAILTRDLSLGSRGTDVTALQTFLIAQGFLSATATGYFGPLTEAAVRQYQAAQSIVSSGTPATTGYGAVGPRTRAALNSTQQAGSSGQGPAGGTPPTTARPTPTPTPIFTGGGSERSPTPTPQPPTPSPTPTPSPSVTPLPVPPTPQLPERPDTPTCAIDTAFIDNCVLE